MFYLVICLCAVVGTFFFARYWSAKTRLVEKNITDVIARKHLTSKHSGELRRLREENGVMRNLLLDMVENETSVTAIHDGMPAADKTRIMNARSQRRHEIFGEAMFILENSEKGHVRARHLTE